jgi:glycerol-3-phosphate dehydrogenase (NAD(P)+)
VARVTVFGAGAMGTAFAMHLARRGHDTVLWGSPFDERVLPSLLEAGRHPALPEALPPSLRVLGPDRLAEAGRGMELGVVGAHSAGARTLTRMVVEACGPPPLLVGVAKGLEPDTGKRMSQVYGEACGHDRVVSVGGPCLAPEVAEGLPTVAVFGAAERETAERAAELFRSPELGVVATDDLPGLEYCTVAKNAAAIGVGLVDGLARVRSRSYSNARAALFVQAFREMEALVVALGGRAETVRGLAGVGDTLVTSFGGRNRLFGEAVGEGMEPRAALESMQARGLTVEGWDATREVVALARRAQVEVPFFAQVHRVLFEGAPPDSLFGCLGG